MQIYEHQLSAILFNMYGLGPSYMHLAIIFRFLKQIYHVSQTEKYSSKGSVKIIAMR